MYKDLTTPQFKALSALAYFCLCKHNAKDKQEKERFYSQANGAQLICALLGVKDEVSWKVRRGEIKGLQNIARFSDHIEYTDNYEFNPY